MEHDPQWQTLFAQEAERIWHALGKNLVVEVEHIGSTAVPGMAAKPVIDIMLGVRSRVSASNFVALDTDKKLKTVSKYQFFIQNRTNCRK